MRDQEKEKEIKVDEVWPEYYENKAREKKKGYLPLLLALVILGYPLYLLYQDYEGSAQQLIDNIIIFLGMSVLCLGIWYGAAWLSRFLEDRKRNKGR